MSNPSSVAGPELAPCSPGHPIAPLNGYHALIDGVGDFSHWAEGSAMMFCLDAVKFADMTLVSGPMIASAGDKVMGIAILAESHCSIHVNRATDVAHVDLFSCKKFPIAGFERFCVERLRLRRHTLHLQ